MNVHNYTAEFAKNDDIYFGISSQSLLSGNENTNDNFQIFIVTSGHLHQVINGETITVKSGDVSFIRKSDICFFKPIKSDNATIVNICLSEQLCRDIFLFFDFDRELLTSRMPFIYNSPEYENFEKEIINYTRSELKLLVSNIFHLLMSFKRENSSDKWTDELLLEMHKKENFSIGVKRLYELSNYSMEHVCREIKQTYGKTPSQIINEIRLDYIAKMLICSDRPITDIAYDCGYNNLSHFHHLFKDYFGVSPLKYRTSNSSILKKSTHNKK